MILVIVAALALLIAVCIYQIRDLTIRIREWTDIMRRTTKLVEAINSMTKETAESGVILAGRVSNNEHRIRDLYKAINQLKGWPNNEVEYRS